MFHNTMMSKIIEFFKLNRWALLSGLLVGTSYTPFPCWALLFCYTPLWLWATRSDVNLRQVFWGAWLTQFLLSLIGFHWVAFVTYEFGHIPWPLALIVLLLFCSLVHLYIPIALTLAVDCGRRLGLSQNWVLLLIPLFLNLMERFWPSLFPWHLGYPLYSSHIPIYQWADVVGFLGLSLLMLLSNSVLAIWWLNRKAWWLPTGLMLTLVILTVGGVFHAKPWDQTDSTIPTLIVQGNIGNFEKEQAEQGQNFQEHIVNHFLDLTRKGAAENPETQLIVWPETAFPGNFDQRTLEFHYQQKVIQTLKSLKMRLITGSYSTEFNSQTGKSVSYNAMAFLDSNGELSGPLYRKTHLLAYGEYLPLSETFPILLTWVPMIANFGRGQGPEVFSLNIKDHAVRWGPQICYEGLYPEFSRNLARLGSQIFVNITNDSWFGQPFEPSQHMYMTFARAIENRRPLIRSTNTGISSVALANGDIQQFSPLHESWTGRFDVAYLQNPPLTFFSKWGHFDALFVLILILITLLIGYRNARIRRP